MVGRRGRARVGRNLVFVSIELSITLLTVFLTNFTKVRLPVGIGKASIFNGNIFVFQKSQRHYFSKSW